MSSVQAQSARRRRRALWFLYANAVLSCYAGTGVLAILNLYLSDYLLLSSAAANAITAAYIVVFSALAPVGGYLSGKRLVRLLRRACGF